jgi:hypothetical protein
MKISKTTKYKNIIVKPSFLPEYIYSDFCIVSVESIKKIAEGVRATDIFDKHPGASVNIHGGDFQFYTDNEKFKAITKFLVDEDQAYIDVKSGEFILLEEVEGFYESYNVVTVYKHGVILKGNFKHTSDIMEAEINL